MLDLFHHNFLSKSANTQSIAAFFEIVVTQNLGAFALVSINQ